LGWGVFFGAWCFSFILSFKFTAISTWAEGQNSGLGEDMLDHLIPYEFDGYPDHVVIGIVMRRP
jgi:hypothetical protein